MKHLRLLAILFAVLLCLAACNRKNESDGGSAPTAAPTETPVPTPTLPPYEPNILTGEPRGEGYVADQRPVAIMINNISAARPQKGLSKADILVEIEVEGGITRLMGIFQDYKTIGEVGPVRSGRDQFFQLILPWQMLYVHEGQSSVMSIYSHDYDYGRESVTINAKTPDARDITNAQGLLNMNTAGAYGHRNTDRYNWNGANYNVITGYTDAGKPIHQLAYEHTLYLNSDELSSYIETESAQGLDMKRVYNSTFFNFVDYRTATGPRDLAASLDSAYSTSYGPVVSDGEYIQITHSGRLGSGQCYATRFIYDAAANQYGMQMYYPDGRWRNVIDEAANNQALSFPNLVVLFTDIHTYPGHEAKDLKEAVYTYGGAGYYCYGGKCERIYWQKGSPLQALQLYYLAEDGKCSDIPLDINMGRTYLAIVDLEEGSVNNYDLFQHTTLDGQDISVAANSSAPGGTIYNEVEIGEDDTSAGTTNTPAATAAPADTSASTDSADHEHTWDAGVIDQPYLCKPGVKTYTCTAGDGATKTEDVPAATEHQFSNGACTVCGEPEPNYTAPETPPVGEDTSAQTETTTDEGSPTE